MQAVNQSQDVGEQASRDCDLGKLERDIATVADDLGADLDQLLSKRRQRPMFHRLGQGERAQEVGEVLGERVQLKPDGIVPEAAATALIA